MSDQARTCPHCGSGLKKWLVPEKASWDEEYVLVCVNNDCAYYVKGWNWMKEQFNQHGSYRYAFNPGNNSQFPLPVWSDTATLEMIVDEPDGAES